MSSTADAAASGPPSVPPERPSALAPLRHPIFRAVWITSLVTNFGGLIQSVGAAWMMTSIASAQMVALVQASITLPIMLLSLAAGALADTVDRRKIMLAAQTFMLLVSAGLAAMTWMGWITPWVLLTFTFLIGCGTAFNGPAWQASVGDMVPREDLAGAVTLNSMGFNMARSVGPALGGMIVAAAGAAAAFAVNAVSYLGLLVVLFRWKPERPKQTLPREGLLAAMAGGVRYAFLSPRVTAVLLRAVVFGVGASAVQALMPVVAREGGGGPLAFGLLLGSFGIGAVGGALFVGRLRAKYETETIVRVAALAFAAAALGLAYIPWLAVTLPALMLAGAGWVLVLSSFNVTVQMSVPRWVVARALALYQMAAFGGMAGGSWLWGSLAQTYGVDVAWAFRRGAGSVRADRPARAPALDRQPQHGPAAPLDRTADRPGDRTAQRAGHRLHRLSHPRGGHRRLPGPDGRTAPHPPPRRRAPVAPDARPGRTADLGREIPDADLAGLHPAQPADHPRGRRRQRRHPRPASGAGQARGASPDRADHRPPGRQSARRPPLRRAADRPDPILLDQACRACPI